jgi:hypothetical protein
MGLRPDEAMIFINLSNLSGSTAPGVHAVSNRNDYQKQKNYVSGV